MDSSAGITKQKKWQQIDWKVGCEEKIDKVSKQCVNYKELLKSVVEKREINEIEKLKSAQEDTVKKLKHRQYYLKKMHDDLIENMSGGVLTFF